MKYVSVADAKNMLGLRLILSAHVPGPWGEAAKAVLSARNVKYIPVEQHVMGPNEELIAWTGIRNAPTVVLNDEPPRAGWIDILMLAERLGSGPSLLSEDPVRRALILGLSCEICGPEGFGWTRRANFRREGAPTPKVPHANNPILPQIHRDYGMTPEAVAKAPARLIALLNGFASILHNQKAAGSRYFVGDRLSAADLYWTCFSIMVKPPAEADCAMPDYMRVNYGAVTPDVAAALDPILIAHRDFIFQQHIGLPLDF
jgi:glutathione S-transferase